MDFIGKPEQNTTLFFIIKKKKKRTNYFRVFTKFFRCFLVCMYRNGKSKNNKSFRRV